jgi:low temperature requirement protein LtrA
MVSRGKRVSVVIVSSVVTAGLFTTTWMLLPRPYALVLIIVVGLLMTIVEPLIMAYDSRKGASQAKEVKTRDRHPTEGA